MERKTKYSLVATGTFVFLVALGIIASDIFAANQQQTFISAVDHTESYYLQNNGTLILQTDGAQTCNATTNGALYYTGTDFFGCNGASWASLTANGAETDPIYSAAAATLATTGNCAPGTVAQNLTTGGPQCVPLTTYTAGNGLQLNSTTFSTNATSCSAGEYSSWDGAAWSCHTDQTGVDGNNYPTDIDVSGTTTKTLHLSRDGLANLSATWSDLDTNDTTRVDALVSANSTTNSRITDVNSTVAAKAGTGSTGDCTYGIRNATLGTAGFSTTSCAANPDTYNTTTQMIAAVNNTGINVGGNAATVTNGVYTTTIVATVGNWSAEKSSYSTTATADTKYLSLGNWSGNASSYTTTGGLVTALGNWTNDKGSYSTSSLTWLKSTTLSGTGASSVCTYGIANITLNNASGATVTCASQQGTLSAETDPLWRGNYSSYTQTSNLVATLGNWSADKGSYLTAATTAAAYTNKSGSETVTGQWTFSPTTNVSFSGSGQVLFDLPVYFRNNVTVTVPQAAVANTTLYVTDIGGVARVNLSVSGSTGTVTANSFVGALTGNADTATALGATADAKYLSLGNWSGNSSSYSASSLTWLKSTSLSGAGASSACTYGVANFTLVNGSTPTVTCAAQQGTLSAETDPLWRGNYSLFTPTSDLVTALGNWTSDKGSYSASTLTWLKSTTLSGTGASSVCTYGIANITLVNGSGATVACAAQQGVGSSNLTMTDVTNGVGNWTGDKGSYSASTLTWLKSTTLSGVGTSTSCTYGVYNVTTVNGSTPTVNCAAQQGTLTGATTAYNSGLTGGCTSGSCTLAVNASTYTTTANADTKYLSLGNWSGNASSYMPKTGGTFTGNVTMAAGQCITTASGGKIC